MRWIVWLTLLTAQAAEPLFEADQAYREGRFEQAAEKLTELSLNDPTNTDILRRLGAARYRMADFDGAARAWDRVSQIEPGDANSRYNAGNALTQSGRLEEAREHFEQALSVEPSHEGAKANEQLVQKEIERRRSEAPPPPPPPPKDGEGGEEGEGGDDDEKPPEDGSNEGSEGESGDNQEPGEPQDGDSESKGGGEPQEGDDPEQQDDGEGDPEGGDEEGSDAEDQGSGGGLGEEQEEGPITQGQAHKLIDGVQEGTPKMIMGGRQTDKPW